MSDAPRYPRDMTGYGATPPAARWPNGARTSVQIVLNYEEGGENNILHGDAASEAFLSEVVGAQPVRLVHSDLFVMELTAGTALELGSPPAIVNVSFPGRLTQGFDK